MIYMLQLFILFSKNLNPNDDLEGFSGVDLYIFSLLWSVNMVSCLFSSLHVWRFSPVGAFFRGTNMWQTPCLILYGNVCHAVAVHSFPRGLD